VRARLADPVTRAKIVKEMIASSKRAGRKDYSYAVVAHCSSDASLDGKSIPEINLLKGRKKGIKNEVQTILDLEAKGGAQMLYHSMSQQDVERILRYANTAVASDGSVGDESGSGIPHPRSYGTNARVLAEFVRERGTISLEDAIRRMTSLPARTFGFHDRGQVREGFWADLVMFDPARVQDKATYTKLHQYSEGFDLVLVNGRPVVDGGRVTGARPGQVLRHRRCL
jgi:N-acyl-D-amino-acid deacylase